MRIEPRARLLMGLVSTLLCAGQGIRQSASAQVVDSVAAIRAATAPTIDGRLDEHEWAEAARLTDFREVSPDEGAEPTESTEVLLLYDDDALYIGARLADSRPDEITARILRQGESLESDDYFAVILDPFLDRRNGYLFRVNANSVREEALFKETTRTDFDWDGIWLAKAGRDARGWVAEIAIPFKTLPFDPNSDTWGTNFTRHVARRQETIGWVSHNRAQDPSSSGVVSGLTGMQQGIGLDLVPSMSLRRSRVAGGGPDDSEVEPSLDLFYRITPALTGALTINTDFSATEVDDRQVNLTRFSLVFPEKRDFFLQDADIFEFGRLASPVGRANPLIENGRPFFSRRIGLSPLSQPVDLDAGAKLTGRIGQWNVGALAVRQDAYVGVDATDLFVGRAALNVLDESSVGMIVTSGDPISNAENTLLGADFRYLNTRLPNGRTLQAEAWLQQSDTPGLDGDDRAFGFGVSMPNTNRFRGGIRYKELEQNFNPALGFLNRPGIRDYKVELLYTHRPRDAYWRTLVGGVEFERIDGLDGGLQTERLEVRAFQLQSHAGDAIALDYNGNREGLLAPFEVSEGIVIPPGVYSFADFHLRTNTGSQRKLVGRFAYRIGEFFEGDREEIVSGLTWRPSPHFGLDLQYEWNNISLPQGDFTTRLARVGVDWVLSATLSWVNLLQYDNVSNLLGVNSRLHWIPEAGREIFLVFNQNLTDENERRSFRTLTSDTTVKLSYTFRF